MQIDEPSDSPLPAPLWRLAFRAGFLLAAAFAVLAMLRWLFWMEQPGRWPASLSPHWWHGHEMVFGFALPVVAGFLLTAVATWTSLPGTRGWRLQLLFGLWLLARGILWLLPQWAWLAWGLETAFILLTLFELTRRVWARRQWRNMWFPGLLLGLAALNSCSYLLADNPLAATRLHYGAVWLITVFVVIIGGRVTPLFTGNRLGFRPPPAPPWLEYGSITSAILVALAVTLSPAEGHGALRALCLVTGVLHLYRLGTWRGWLALRVPLLWSMHLSYLCIPLTLFGLGLAGDDPVATKNLVHLLAVGTVGGMILAMMARVSLGHTGRPLDVPWWIGVAFALVLLAALFRALLPLLEPTLGGAAWRWSAGLWATAFSLFLLRYIPVLTSPRADGKPG